MQSNIHKTKESINQIDSSVENETEIVKLDDKEHNDNICEKISLFEKNLSIFTDNTKKIPIDKFNNEIISLKKDILEINMKNQAEIENIRKRALKDIQKIERLALEKFIIELLPVIDNLERAIEASNKIEDVFLISFIQGVELTLKSLNNLLSNFGVSIIDKNNVIFNPAIHQAVSIVETDNLLPDHVLIIMQKGYLLNGKLIRPAMVTVSKKIECKTK